MNSLASIEVGGFFVFAAEFKTTRNQFSSHPAYHESAEGVSGKQLEQDQISIKS